jgi:hypothetical protein
MFVESVEKAMVNKQKVFTYIDNLMDGTVDLQDAVTNVMKRFYVTRKMAFRLLHEWMQTYDERHGENDNDDDVN